MPRIIQNAIELPDKTILMSRSTHDYQSKDGYSVDGGIDYLRYGFPVGCENKFKILSLYDNSSFIDRKEKLVWGTYGKNSEHPLKWVRLTNCETDHLINILRLQKRRNNTLYIDILKSILNDRNIKERTKKIKMIISKIK